MAKELIFAGFKAIYSKVLGGEVFDESDDIKEEKPDEMVVVSEDNVYCNTDRSSRSRERRERCRCRSNERSTSKRRNKRSPSFSDREIGGNRRSSSQDMSEVNVLSVSYDRVYKSDEFFKDTKVRGQFIIVDSGCPRALMGEQEYKMLKKSYRTEEMKLRRNERFRFGPSRVYESEYKAILCIQLGNTEIKAEFFVVKGNIPILLGNDVLKPLGGNINLDKSKLDLKKVHESIDMIETSGGHYVIPVKEIAVHKHQEDKFDNVNKDHENLNGEEADVVMLILLAESETHDDIENVHKEIGHAAFVGLALTLDEEKEVKKVHKYFGHKSGRRVWELFAKADKLKGKKPEVLEVIENCKVCSQMRKSPPRPKVGLPVANDFNEVVGMDLKVVDKNKGEYILWIVDLFSKLIKGKFIKNKNPSTVIEGIIETWIIGGGTGPGHPTKGFWTDNGGEFLNNEMVNFAAAMDIDIKMTSAEAPWQNGVVERHHASADIIVEKLMKENPSMHPQEAIDHAAFARNSEINKTRFSALQLMMGQTPHFPGLGEANPASSNMKSSNKYLRTLKHIDDARVMFRKVDCDERL